MADAECSQKVEKRSKKQQMAVEAIAMALMMQQNRGVNISEPPIGSQDTPRTNESMKDRNSGPKGKGKAVFDTGEIMNDRNSGPKGKGKDKAVFDTGELMNDQNSKPNSKVTSKAKTNAPKMVKFNALGQPVGKKAAPFAHFLSKTAQGFVALTIPNWHKALTVAYKDLIWNHVKKHYIVDDCHRKLCFQNMARYWRDHRSKTIKDIEERVKSASVEAVAKATQPANVHSLVDWTKFVKFSLSPGEKKRRNYYVEMRKRRVLKYRGSKKGFTRIAYEMKKKSENPDAITRVDVWLAGYSRKKKDGDEEVEDPEVVRQVKEKLAEQPDSSQWSINDDPVSQVLGPERRGRVRATPSQLIGRSQVDFRVSMLEKKLQDMEMKFDAAFSQRSKEAHSSENDNIANPPFHIDNSMDDTIVPQKRKEVPCVSTSYKQVKISKGEKQTQLVENVNNKTLQTQHLLLLRWYGTEEKIVAFGDLASKDPDDKVHCIRLGTGIWKVWVREVIEDIALYRQTEEFSTLSTAKGSTVAWPSECIKLL